MKSEEKAIETAPIRLSADETRAIIRALAAGGKPIQDYRCDGLVSLGLMRPAVIPPVDESKAETTAWHALVVASKLRNMRDVKKAMSELERISSNRARKQNGFVLTPLGSQVARGVSVRMGAQFK